MLLFYFVARLGNLPPPLSLSLSLSLDYILPLLKQSRRAPSLERRTSRTVEFSPLVVVRSRFRNDFWHPCF